MVPRVSQPTARQVCERRDVGIGERTVVRPNIEQADSGSGRLFEIGTQLADPDRVGDEGCVGNEPGPGGDGEQVDKHGAIMEVALGNTVMRCRKGMSDYGLRIPVDVQWRTVVEHTGAPDDRTNTSAHREEDGPRRRGARIELPSQGSGSSGRCNLDLACS